MLPPDSWISTEEKDLQLIVSLCDSDYCDNITTVIVWYITAAGLIAESV